MMKEAKRMKIKMRKYKIMLTNNTSSNTVTMAPNWFVSISIMLELSIHTDTTG